jgi:hypothetical protein
LGKCGALLGFVSPASGISIISDSVLKWREDDHFYLKLANVKSHGLFNVDNFSDTKVRVSNIVGAITLIGDPFSLCTYRAFDNAYGVYIQEKSLNGHLRLEFVNRKGEPVDYLPDHELVLKVEVFKSNTVETREQANMSKQMVDYMRLMFLSQNMNQ